MAMRDGLYKVAFGTQMGEGFGVVTLSNGQVRGGDAGLFYVGTFQQTGDDFRAEVQIDRHTNVPGIVSVFGIDRVRIVLAGKSQNDSGRMQGSSPDAPGVSFSATLTRIAD
jgi:hypothetical protein